MTYEVLAVVTPIVGACILSLLGFVWRDMNRRVISLEERSQKFGETCAVLQTKMETVEILVNQLHKKFDQMRKEIHAEKEDN